MDILARFLGQVHMESREDCPNSKIMQLAYEKQALLSVIESAINEDRDIQTVMGEALSRRKRHAA